MNQGWIRLCYHGVMEPKGGYAWRYSIQLNELLCM
jgi:hypothetical protein